MSNTRVLTVLLLLLASSLLVAAGFSSVYDDTYARWLVKVNGAAYAKDPASCIKNIPELGGDWQVVRVKQTECSPTPGLSSQCQVIILKSNVQKQYIVSYRGSVGNSQLIEQGVNTALLPFENYGRVNSYYHKAFNGLWPSVVTALIGARSQGYSIVVTGFSLGGALATITGLKVVGDGLQTSDNVYLLTYGSPRVGNGNFAKNVDKLVKFRHRVVNQGDPIPHFPDCTSMWPGTCTSLGDYHSQQEIWYPNGSGPNSKYYSSTCSEDPKGSNQLNIFRRKLAHHLAYFGYDLEKFGNNNCK